MPESTDHLGDFDALYTGTLTNIMNFFRYEKTHPGAVKFNDEYYKQAAEAMKARIDHEIKYLHSPYI